MQVSPDTAQHVNVTVKKRKSLNIHESPYISQAWAVHTYPATQKNCEVVVSQPHLDSITPYLAALTQARFAMFYIFRYVIAVIHLKMDLSDDYFRQIV